MVKADNMSKIVIDQLNEELEEKTKEYEEMKEMKEELEK